MNATCFRSRSINLPSVIGLLSVTLWLGVSVVQAEPPRLIVRGDDMGFSHSGNEALIRCFSEGIETSIEVIAPSPWFPEAVKLLAEHPQVDVGVHLALTSEWDNLKWRPLSSAPSLRDEDGYLFPMIWPNENYPGRALKQHPFTITDIEAEFRAQIELVKKHVLGSVISLATWAATELALKPSAW